MRASIIAGPDLFSELGIGSTFFPSRATFQQPARQLSASGDLDLSGDGAWSNVAGYESMPCAIGPIVTGRPASSVEKRNPFEVNDSVEQSNRFYIMLMGYCPRIDTKWRVIVDGVLYTSAPNNDGGDLDVWGLEHDSQHTFTRLAAHRSTF